jgi:hypothetical protein
MMSGSLEPSVEWFSQLATVGRRIAEAHEMPQRMSRAAAVFVAVTELEKVRGG